MGSAVAAFLKLERAALARLWARRSALVLAIACPIVGALGLFTAVARVRLSFHLGDLAQLRHALAATGLGLDLFLVATMMGVGLATVAVASPRTGAGLALPAARSSGGVFSIYMLAFVVAYALMLGYARLLPSLAGREGPLWARAVMVSLALVPSLIVLVILSAASLAAVTLVARGVRPGRAVASGLDHVMRRPAQALALFFTHAAIGAGLFGLVVAIAGGKGLVAAAPIAVLALAWAAAAFDAALGADARLVSG